MRSETLRDLVDSQQALFDKTDAEADERATSYPLTYEDYLALPLNDRLTVALNIFKDDAPVTIASGQYASERSFIFPIEIPENDTGIQTSAKIKYSVGTYSRPSGLSVSIVSTRDGYINTAFLGYLKQNVIQRDVWGPNPTIVGREYEVISSFQTMNSTTDPDDQLFKDVIFVVDEGINQIYRARLTSRISKLGKLTTK
jgi:hypothetical protein